MNIHEYQGKAMLRDFGVGTPHGIPCFSADEGADTGYAVRIIQ